MHTRMNPKEFLTADQETMERILPRPLAHLAAAIGASRTMLALAPDWDGEGSTGYAETTWLLAIDFLVENALSLSEKYGVIIEAPKVRKGPAGSIDLHWRTPGRELLVNVPAAKELPADYYGDDGSGGHVVKGTLDPTEENHWLLMWLAKR